MSWRARFFAILTALAIVCLASSGMAANFFVASTGNDTTGGSWANAYQKLESAVAAANAAGGADVIFMAAEGQLLTSMTPLTITEDLTINGGYDASDGTRATTTTRTTVGHAVIEIINGTGEITETTASNLTSYTAGAFFINSGLTVLLDQVDVTSCVSRTASLAGGFPTTDQMFTRAAVHAEPGGSLTLNNCDLFNNLSAGKKEETYNCNAVSVRHGGALTMTNCVVSDNTGMFDSAAGNPFLSRGHGSGVLVEGTADVRRCVFQNNKAGLEVTDGNLKNANTALAILPPIEGPCVIEDCLFDNNKGSNRGGALRIAWDTTATLYTITNCTFTGNTARDGGAINFSKVYRTLPATSITLNTDGMRGVGQMVMANCTFTGNSATMCDGGAIRRFGNGVDLAGTRSTVTDCTFTNNVAQKGGALAWKEFDALELTNCSFVSNTALSVAYNAGGGAALITEASNKTGDSDSGYIITNCLFKDNYTSSAYASAMGGVIDNGGNAGNGSNLGPKVYVVNSTFIDNTTNKGGVIRQGGASTPTLQVVNTVMQGNSLNGIAAVAAATGNGRVASSAINQGATAVGGTAAGSITQSAVDVTNETFLVSTGAIGNASSNCVNAGLDSDGIVTIPATDMLGTGRTGVTDIGALEYGGVVLLAPPDISTDKASVPFGDETHEDTVTSDVTVSNAAAPRFDATYSYEITGADAAEFSVAHFSGSTSPLAGGSSEVLRITWVVGLTPGARTAALEITHNDPVDSSPIVIPLTGTSVPVDVSVFRVE